LRIYDPFISGNVWMLRASYGTAVAGFRSAEETCGRRGICMEIPPLTSVHSRKRMDVKNAARNYHR
jgi:hypothetical protein